MPFQPSNNTRGTANTNKLMYITSNYNQIILYILCTGVRGGGSLPYLKVVGNMHQIDPNFTHVSILLFPFSSTAKSHWPPFSAFETDFFLLYLVPEIISAKTYFYINLVTANLDLVDSFLKFFHSLHIRLTPFFRHHQILLSPLLYHTPKTPTKLSRESPFPDKNLTDKIKQVKLTHLDCSFSNYIIYPTWKVKKNMTSFIINYLFYNR